jgi:hypothetical protein
MGGITVPIAVGDKYGSRTVVSILPLKGQSSGRRRLEWTCICGATGDCLTSSFRQLDPCKECEAKRILDALGPQVVGTTLPRVRGRPFSLAIGDRRGTRVVTHFVLGSVQTKVGWKCNCGRVGITDGGDFKKSFICKTCLGSYSNASHNLSDSRLYAIWRGMKSRTGGTQGWRGRRYYVDKGIELCAEWQAFKPFYDWSVANGYADGLTIDRIYSCRGYNPQNCEWVTKAENSRRAHQDLWRQYDNTPLEMLCGFGTWLGPEWGVH